MARSKKEGNKRINRYLEGQVKQDILQKMVFIGGPRQVGKTFLAKKFIHRDAQYLNWDLAEDRRVILADQIDISQKLIVLDEVHKYKMWRTLVKGLYDKYHPRLNFIVTGSARLDYFRKGGDSLLGRYHYLRLHPLSLGEVSANPQKSDMLDLLKYSGFPEVFLKKDTTYLNRWQAERAQRVIHQDLRDLENVKEITLIELLAQALRARVGSTVSIKSLAEDLRVSPITVERWVQILEKLYYCYRVAPYGPPKIKAVKKAQKLFMWDWTEAELPGARFENLVASQLLKFCHLQEDTLGLRTELRYFKDVITEKEIDFIVLQKGNPLFAVECKTGERARSESFTRFGKKLNIPKLYQVHAGDRDYGVEESCRVLPFYVFCRELKMP